MKTLLSTKAWLWLLWIGLTLGLLGWFSYMLLQDSDPQLFMPGPLSAGHHQFADSCTVCHTDPLGGKEVIQEACFNCHKDERKKPFDSHPSTKFKDPRNADTLQNIDALHCMTCHTEHKPEITRKNGVTQPVDFCMHCHADIGEERVSHKEMAFTTCANGGCHNFHNNRDIYTDFLMKHQNEPELLAVRVVPERDLASALEEIMEYPHDKYPLESLTLDQADMPAGITLGDSVKHDWLTTSHAAAGVNCSACHLVAITEEVDPAWTDNPGDSACVNCHSLEQQRFEKGKHGMRLAAGLSPMSVNQAMLPMQSDAAHAELNCLSCHGAHTFDTRTAAVDACLSCHADEHSLAYEGSPHHRLWIEEQVGELPAGSGVSCATCHMPRLEFDVSEWSSRTGVDHNQSANLSPNTKMLRSSCLHCHGMGFAMDALADSNLIKNNFVGKPGVHVESLRLAQEDYDRAMAERQEADNSE